MNRTRIINLIGSSGSGKSTVAKELEKLGYNVIQSYTTREPRYECEWGHRFVNGWIDEEDRGFWIESCGFVGLIRWNKIIAYFNSYKSDNHYFATDDQVLRGETNIYIVDPLGARQVHDYYEGSEVDVITIYLQVDEQIRAKRMLDRMEDKSFTKYFIDDPIKCPEVYARIRPDREIFEVVKSDYTICGRNNIEEVTKLVANIIEED